MDRELKEKLRVLLDYWIEHNEEHGEEFGEWADKSVGPEWAGIRDDLMRAREGMEGVNTVLRGALEKLEGLE
jgi:hypothetical protein